MKNLLVILSLSLSISAGAQNVSGFYTGTLYNDSTKMIQKYELALSDYRGKIDGYSYVTFVKNDTFYYGIRKVKARIIGDSLIVQDDKMISNNFPEPPAKGVGRVITIPLKGQDSLVIVSGKWKTNQTKKYYSVPGAIDLTRSSDSTNSPLISHLQELNLIETPVYYQNMTTQPLASTEVKNEEAKNIQASTSGKKKRVSKTDKKEADEAMQNTTTAKDNTKIVSVVTPSSKREKNSKMEIARDSKPSDSLALAASKEIPVKKEPSKLKKEETQISDTRTEIDGAELTNKDTAKPKRKDSKQTPGTGAETSIAETKPAPVPYTERKNRVIHTIEVTSDSLILSFYDNGVVDGDSVSVYLDGEAVAQNLRLTTNAAKRTVAVRNTGESNLLLVAENLGRLPPNTGLITIRDGDELYQVHFSADMLTNATIVIRRKK